MSGREDSEDQRPKENRDTSNDRQPGDYNVETFRHAIEDARRTHEYQIEAYDDIDEKSWRVLRFNGVVATVAVAGAVNLSPPFSTFVWVFALGGLGCLVYSTYLALDGQPENEITVGPSGDDFQTVVEKNPQEPVYLSWMVQNYADYTEEGVEKVEKNAEAVDRAKVFTIIGVGVLLTSGLLYAATGLI